MPRISVLNQIMLPESPPPSYASAVVAGERRPQVSSSTSVQLDHLSLGPSSPIQEPFDQYETGYLRSYEIRNFIHTLESRAEQLQLRSLRLCRIFFFGLVVNIFGSILIWSISLQGPTTVMQPCYRTVNSTWECDSNLLQSIGCKADVNLWKDRILNLHSCCNPNRTATLTTFCSLTENRFRQLSAAARRDQSRRDAKRTGYYPS
jgi:hypothetical protein